MYISSRNTDAIVKVNVSSGDVLWTLGGPYGDYDIVDFDGTKYAAGSSLWAGQHNAEYFGDDEYCMFDNQYDSGNNSRLLCVVLDESEAYAYLSWEYDTGDYSPHFGDNDRLPTGNMLGCFWPMYQYDDADQFDERAIEVTRPGGETAWQLDVKGVKCDESECKRAAGSGWTFYSIERFYTAPLLYNVACAGGQLTFSTHNNFKQSDASEAHYEVTSGGSKVASGTFYFTPHWRDTLVAVDVTGTTGEVDVTVRNTWGDETLESVECS